MRATRHKQAGAELLFPEAKGANVAFHPPTSRTEDNLVSKRKQREDEEVPQERAAADRLRAACAPRHERSLVC